MRFFRSRLTWLLAAPLALGYVPATAEDSSDETEAAARRVIAELLAARPRPARDEQAATKKADDEGSERVDAPASTLPATEKPLAPDPVTPKKKRAEPEKAKDGDAVATPKRRVDPVVRLKAARGSGTGKRSTEGADDAAAVIDGIVGRNDDRIAANRRDALFLHQQAQALATAGKNSDALKLARSAQKLYPDSKAIAASVADLEKRIRGDRLVTVSYARPKARVALALTRGQSLLKAGKDAAAVDLLDGVVRATLLFPEDARAGIYRRLAQRDLDRHAEQAAAKPVGDAKPPALNRSGRSEPSAAPPNNLRRLADGAANAAPLWYATGKNRLAARMTVDYRNVPLAAVFEEIADATGVTIVVDRPVSLARSHLYDKLNLRIAEATAETILNLACMQGGLEYVIMERSVVITVPSKAREYARRFPATLRDNWFAARTLFPALDPELIASTPAEPAPSTAEEAEGVPTYLASGEGLVEEVRRLLR